MMRRFWVFLLLLGALSCGDDGPSRPEQPDPPRILSFTLQPRSIVSGTVSARVIAERFASPLAARESKFAAVGVPDHRSDPQLRLLVDEVVGGSGVDSEEGGPHGAERRRLARFVEAVDDVESLASVGEVQIKIREGAVGLERKPGEPHGCPSAGRSSATSR